MFSSLGLWHLLQGKDSAGAGEEHSLQSIRTTAAEQSHLLPVSLANPAECELMGQPSPFKHDLTA